jgi:predicted thioesterase
MTITVGEKFTRTFTVDDTRAISFLGPELRVYATPRIVGDLEFSCRDWLLGKVDEGQDSVGVRVEVEHKRGTPMGMTVTHEFEVVEVDRARITFAITVRDTLEEVAVARHTRAVVAKTRVAEAVKAKRARAGLA